ncbi:hypothetical protein [Pseudacidovorax sp. NFM-22]|uniref:hypothetical protein n=1 Tax=Pseudacidovorax sp. NFM-22 TaxID=2744469 RepID=UPI001F3FB021|nr:hypothetical protein [Pseudacidovorax sp. NFM-22]
MSRLQAAIADLLDRRLTADEAADRHFAPDVRQRAARCARTVWRIEEATFPLRPRA